MRAETLKYIYNSKAENKAEEITQTLETWKIKIQDSHYQTTEILEDRKKKKKLSKI